ncbi:hypothetical protein DCC77_00320 [Candidatus Uhrbacteria bacterium]|nr:MAG: hypothetical protein DCC77_00320 [Candidatus Uhrbacteria bacterium]
MNNSLQPERVNRERIQGYAESVKDSSSRGAVGAQHAAPLLRLTSKQKHVRFSLRTFQKEEASP